MSKVKWTFGVLLVFPTLLSAHYHHHYHADKKKEIIKFPEFTSLNTIYYDLRSNTPLKLFNNESERITPLKFFSSGIPCACGNLTCGCCAGMNIEFIKFNSTMCTNMTVVPEEFALDIRLFMDDREMFKNRMTARNPPPFCIPLYFFPVITFCVRLYDIIVLDSRLNVCIDFETRIAGWPILVLHFDCVRVGQGEVFWTKPLVNTPKPEFQIPIQIQFASGEPYDVVNFEPTNDNITSLYNNTGLTIEQENQIGTLKIS